MDHFAIVVAGGHGARMASEIPKQFMPLCGEPVLAHTLRKFASIGSETVLVLHPDWIPYWEGLSLNLKNLPKHRIVAGNTTRAGSVYNGLSTLPDHGLVAVHDAARPIVSETLISRLFDHAAAHGNAIPVMECRDSLRQIEGDSSKAIDRTLYRVVQTPQVFTLNSLKQAFGSGAFESFTDEASLVESFGVPIHMIPGEESNIKITFPIDFRIAEAWMSTSNAP